MFIVYIIQHHGSTSKVVSEELTFNIHICVLIGWSKAYFLGLYIVLCHGNKCWLNNLGHSKYIILKHSNGVQRLHWFYKTLQAMEDTWVGSFHYKDGASIEEKREKDAGFNGNEHSSVYVASTSSEDNHL